MIHALVTRPAEDAREIARALESRGIAVVSEPLLTIRPKPDVSVDTDGVQALLFTSANGARAFARISSDRSLPAYAVGDATAEALRGLGFTRVESAGGNADDLERLVRQRLDPAKGRLLHPAGTSVAGDLAGRLSGAGFQVDRVALYDAGPADSLGDEARQAIADGRIDWVLVFSPRTAATFASVIDKAGLVPAVRRMTLIALSPAVAKATTLPFAEVVVAADPTLAALLAAVDELIRNKAPMTPPTTTPPPSASAMPPPRRSSVSLMIAAAVVSAMISAAVVVASRQLPETPAAATSAPAVDLGPLRQRIDKLEASVAALAKHLDEVAGDAQRAGAKAAAAADAAAARPAEAPAPVSPPPTDLGPIEKRLATVEQSVADVTRRVLAETDTERRLAEVERLAKSDRRLDAAALAAIKLGEALAAGRPYRSELAALGGVPAVEATAKVLSAHADTGVPTRASLAERFAAAASAASRSGDMPEDLWGQALAKLRSLVSVRRIQAGDDLDGRLARAEQALGRGDLADAVAALDGLPAAAAQAMASWKADAAARLAAERAFDGVTQAIAAGLGRAG